MSTYTRPFSSLGLADVPLVGGKTASLGELAQLLAGGEITVPGGFAITAEAYRDALAAAGAWPKLHQALDGLDLTDVSALSRAAATARSIVYQATGGPELAQQIVEAYRVLLDAIGQDATVAVRSSATAEDLPNASFAGQHDSFLHIRGEKDVVEACRKCFASIFTDRAIVYRAQNGFDHFKVALSVAVMQMVRSDQAASGVIFTLDTESGFRDVVFVTGAYGRGKASFRAGSIPTNSTFTSPPSGRAIGRSCAAASAPSRGGWRGAAAPAGPCSPCRWRGRSGSGSA